MALFKPYKGLVTHEGTKYWYHYDIDPIENKCKKYKALNAKNYAAAEKEALKIDNENLTKQ
ncbi:hypothetical protein BAS10_07420 [Elizabethkingia meningoseptica]|uniref:hypothetical protein n=1 Tax=Elizabethkingia meningoseptica TaxID=238 RepID=UPI00099A61FC|nr:hypothetical protein [Elizabethkingia meningoseptica]OPB96870.1 hypothetical protein BAS10_07420 [Elizabethkingia meningoseptica]